MRMGADSNEGSTTMKAKSKSINKKLWCGVNRQMVVYKYLGVGFRNDEARLWVR